VAVRGALGVADASCVYGVSAWRWGCERAMVLCGSTIVSGRAQGRATLILLCREGHEISGLLGGRGVRHYGQGQADVAA